MAEAVSNGRNDNPSDRMSGQSEGPKMLGGSAINVSRRTLLTKAAPALAVASISTSSAFAPEALASTNSGKRVVNLMDFGAKGDGIEDDTFAFRAALSAAQVVEIPPGSFRIEAPLRLSNGQLLRGVGRSGWEPYSGKGPPSSAIKTEIMVDGKLAIDASNTNNAGVSGLALRAKNGRQSNWGGQPGFQPDTIGIDIAGSLQFKATDVSFHGLEVGISGVADNLRTAQMPQISDWAAEDCGAVFRFTSADERLIAVRDARIEGCIAALHCGRIVEAKHCDGLRIENVRFFQCSANSLMIENSQFVTIANATLFETGEETVRLRDCEYITIAACQLVRAGFYVATPLVQRAALSAEGCVSLSFEGLVEQPVGRAFWIKNCSNVSIRAAIGTPFWSTGSLGSNDGAIFIEGSSAIAIDASFSGADYWIAVWADAISGSTINGRISTEGSAGTIRCTHLQAPPLGHVTRTSPGGTIQARSSRTLDTLRILVPASMSLVSRSVELTSPNLVFEAGGQRWEGNILIEPGNGTLSLERKLLYRNGGMDAEYAIIPIGLFNPSNRQTDIPSGHEIRLSLAIE